MKSSAYYLFGIFLCLTLCVGCDRLFIKPDPTSEPERNFEVFWNDINNTYPFFAYDKIKWDSIYKIHRPSITPNTSEAQLFEEFKAMLRPLLDGHISLKKENGRETWINERHYNYTTHFNFNSINRSYLGNKAVYFKWPNVERATKLDTILRYGFIENENLLYFNIRTFSTYYAYQNKLDSLVRENPGLKGLILDIRNNGGGFAKTMEQLSSIFVNGNLTYGYNKKKLGPLEDNFSPLFPLTVTQNTKLSSISPVVLLTNRFSFSAAEHFTLVMKRLPNVTIIGDTTGGAFSPILERALPNGMKYIVTNSVTYDVNQVLYEKIGIPPEIFVTTSRADSLLAKDKILEKAIELLK